MSQKQILIFIDWFTPGYKAGGPVSSNANLIAHLHTGFQFRVVTRNTEYMENEPYADITPNQWISMQHFGGYYFDKQHLSFSAMRKLIRNEPAATAYVNGIYSWYFSILPLILLKYYNKKVIVSARGMLSPHALAVKGFRKKLFLFLATKAGLYRKVTFHATNQEEADYIQQVIGAKCNISIAPNLPKPASALNTTLQKIPGELKLIYIGRIAPEKNTLFAIETLLLFAEKNCSQKQSKSPHEITNESSNSANNPESRNPGIRNLESQNFESITLSIYGSIYNSDYWAECQTLINRLPENIKVIYHGSVEPDEIPSVLNQHHFLFQPSKGENYGHTIAESLQNGIPVIISDRTPWKGLGRVYSSQSIVDGEEKSIVDSRWSIDDKGNRTNAGEKGEGENSGNLESEIWNKNSSVGWDLPLEHPEQFVKAIEYCAAMGQEEYNAMSQRAFEYAKQVTENPEVLEANRRLFG